MPSKKRKEVKYIHRGPNQQITAIGGHYVLVKEVRLPYDGRDILYLVGHAAFDSTCCGTGGCAYALVPGFVVSWHNNLTEDGLAISQLEPIMDADAQNEIRQVIHRWPVVLGGTAIQYASMPLPTLPLLP
jgi:hypothetical protein